MGRPSRLNAFTIHIYLLAAAAGGLSASARLQATTLIPPRDLAELAAGSDAVVLAMADASTPLKKGTVIFTATHFLVERVLSGDITARSTIRVEVPGGRSGDEVWRVEGAPHFRGGDTYLLFLDHGLDGTWVPVMLSYGILKETTGGGGIRILVPLAEARQSQMLPRPDGTIPEAIVPYEEELLLDHLGRVISGSVPWSASLVAAGPDEVAGSGAGSVDDLPGQGAAPPGGCAFFSDSGMNFRWSLFDSSGSLTIYADAAGDPSVAGDPFRLVQEALNTWMNISGTSLNLVFGGPQAQRLCQGEDERGDMIYFNDPCSSIGDLANCSGALAVGGPYAAGTHRFDGANWITCVGWRVIVNNGAGCIGDNAYRIMLAHELGHGLGFGHVNDAGSLMYAYCCNEPNATDRSCTRYTYPPVDPANQRPQVDAGDDLTVSLAGNAIRIHGTVSDDGLPANPGAVTTTWAKLGGPGSVTFAQSTDPETTATFSESGRYLLGLTAWDGQLLRTSAITASVDIWVGSKSVLTFQQGVAGYRGMVDTFIRQSSPTTNNSAARELTVDADDPGGSGQDTQSLLRFDDIFGSGNEQVPPGVTIGSAWLDLTTTDAGDGAALHRMKDTWSATAGWSSFGGNGVQAGSEALTAADVSIAGGSGVPRADVTKSLAAWSAAPCSNHGWALLPLGDNGWTFYSAEGTDPPRLTVEFIPYREETLVRVGDSWRYFKGTAAPAADWSETDFVPGAAWLSGRTGIGYGDGDDTTVLQDMQGRYAAIFCRREFQLADASAIGRLLLRIDYDDGFVAYLNGAEVARSSSMQATGSPVAWNALAASREAGAYEEYSLPVEHLKDGKNVIAVEVHNAEVGSSDLSFIPELTGSFLLIDGGAVWRFLRGSQQVPVGWNRREFDDSSWEEGPAGIGYGDGDDLTELTEMQGNYLAVFCRRTFEVKDPGALGEVFLTVICDDGFVAYLNGAEVGRANMPAGAATATTPATASVETTPTRLRIPAERFVAGANVLAVSVHNSDLDSSDLSFSAVLVPEAVRRRHVDCDASFRRGDGGSDGSIDISDAIRLLLHLFVDGKDLSCADAADFDDDGALQITDAIQLLGFLFLQGPAPHLPGPTCGQDPTPDDFDDCSTVGCSG